MGAYLSEPVTEKITSKDENEFFQVAASSMQGWRINQEDAHNCILSFDENGPTAFFAVYDGHGGSEVAEYCSLKLAKFLKETEAYKSGNIEQALKDTFINFDQTLLLPEVIAELKDLAKKNPDYQPSDEEDEDEENISDLYQEAKMPLKEVLEKYSKLPRLENLKAGSSSKPLSPCLKSKSSRISDAGGSSSSAGPSSSSSEAKPVEADDTVSSSSSKEVSAKEQESNEPSSSTSASSKSIELDSTTEKPEKADAGKEKTSSCDSNALVNGDVEGSQSISKTNDDQISSSSLLENGEVSSNSKPSVVEAGSAAGSSSSSTENLPTRAAKINSITSSARAIAMDEEDEDTSTDEENDVSFKVDKTVEDDDDEEDEDEDTEDGDEDNFDDMEEEEEDDDDDDTMTYEDEEFMNNMVDEPGKDSGCTAVAAVLRGRDLWVANAGDSRCIVCRDGKVVEMSFDHKPEDQIEFDRIKNAGGRVSADGRVNGGLNLSRAIGDHGYKTNSALKPQEQMISALPDIKKITLTDKDEFMVLACDGIWNFMSNEEVVEFVKAELKKQKSLTDICAELFDKCLAPNTMGDGTGCDNMTAIIVVFKPELYEKIKCETAEAGDLNVTTNGGKKRQVDEEVSGEAESTESVASKRQKIEDDTETAPVSVDTSTT